MEKVESKTASQEFIRLEDTYGAHNYHPLDIVVARAEGSWVWDVEGNKYLDFLAAYSAVNQGHAHPRIRKALEEQASKVTLTSRAFRSDQLGPLYKELHDLTGYQRFLPMNTGAEGVETAIKAARKWGYKIKGIPEGKAEIVVFTGNFHGRTTTIISFSDDPQYRDGFGPFTACFVMVPYGDIEAVKRAVNANTAAVLVEPIQGESGINVPPKGFLKGIEALCKEKNVLFIADEIQSGLGRTGKLFCHHWEDVRPDVVIVGKALGGGFYPISGILADDKVMQVFNPGDHGSTFGGNPLACAVAREALRVIVDEKLPERAAQLGAYFRALLRELYSPLVKEVRGMGLLIGVELKPQAGPARPFCERLMHLGVLCKETHDSVIRFAPPLIIERHEIDWAITQVKQVLS
jgi:ornithine--oxo-acid transaminase